MYVSVGIENSNKCWKYVVYEYIYIYFMIVDNTYFFNEKVYIWYIAPVFIFTTFVVYVIVGAVGCLEDTKEIDAFQTLF